MPSWDWGSVPEYLPGFALLGGAVAFWRERGARRKIEEEDQARRKKSLALIIGDLVLYEPGQDDIVLKVHNYSDSPAFFTKFNVTQKIHRNGGEGGVVHPSEEVERKLTTVDFGTVGPGETSMKVFAGRREAPGLTHDDFEWTVEFRDVLGDLWTRTNDGKLVAGT